MPESECRVSFPGLNVAALAGQKCLLPISMGQKQDPRQEGEHFEQTLKELAANGVAEIHIAIADSLYRHTMPKEEALKLGADWLERNECHLNKIQELYPDLKIFCHRWDEFITDSEFQTHADTVSELYDNGNIKESFDGTALKFLTKHTGESYGPDWNTRMDNSLKFLKEEAAVLLLWKKYECKFLIYVNKATDAINAIYRRKDLIPEGQLQYLTLKFKTPKVSSTQQEIKVPCQIEDFATLSATSFGFYSGSYRSTIPVTLNPSEALAALMTGFVQAMRGGAANDGAMAILAADFGVLLFDRMSSKPPHQSEVNKTV